jgi:hypothetical protein
MPTEIDAVQSGALVPDHTSETLVPVNAKNSLEQERPVETEKPYHFGGQSQGSETELVEPHPTPEELEGHGALRRISANIPLSVYTVAFVELCERFSYYGTQVVCKCCPNPHPVFRFWIRLGDERQDIYLQF